MAQIREIAHNLRSLLERKYLGEWNGRPLTLYNFFAQGNQGGIRIGRGTTDGDVCTRKVDIGRVFPIMDDDHYEANILALELAENIQKTVNSWANCTPAVQDASNFLTDWAVAPLNQVAYEPRPTDREVSTTTTRSPIVTPAEVTPAFAAVSIVSFDLLYFL